jgi:cytochrome P450
MQADPTPAPLRYQDLPGPRAWPLVGNALQMDRERLHEQLAEWSRRYGGTFSLRLGSRRAIVLTEAEAIARVLRDRPEGFQRSARLEKISRELGFPGLFTANGDDWRRQRPMVLHGLDPGHIKTFFPTLVEVTQRLARRWQRTAGTHVDLQADLMRFTVDVTTALALGDDMNTLESAQDKTIQAHLNVVLPALFRRALAPFEYWKYLPLKAERELEPHLRALRAEVQALIDKAHVALVREPQLREHPANMLQAMVAASEREGSGLTDADVAGNVLTMLLAGEDTTANTLAWMVWLLFRNPAALARARDEAREVLGGASCPSALEQLAQLPWIEACAHEAMRLKPVAPLVIVQACQDTVVGGVQVPRGTLAMCLLREPALDAKHFADPAAFAPERWLAGEQAAPGSAKRVAMPFGAGPRMCPGRYLALTEIKMVAGMLLAGFELEDVSTPDGGAPREKLAFAMGPVGLRMRVAPRK